MSMPKREADVLAATIITAVPYRRSHAVSDRARLEDNGRVPYDSRVSKINTRVVDVFVVNIRRKICAIRRWEMI